MQIVPLRRDEASTLARAFSQLAWWYEVCDTTILVTIGTLAPRYDANSCTTPGRTIHQSSRLSAYISRITAYSRKRSTSLSNAHFGTNLLVACTN
jgi:hypothetical protein